MHDPRFRRNLIFVAAFHILLLGTLLYLARRPASRAAGDIVWMDPGSFSQAMIPADEEQEEETADPTPGQPPRPRNLLLNLLLRQPPSRLQMRKPSPSTPRRHPRLLQPQPLSPLRRQSRRQSPHQRQRPNRHQRQRPSPRPLPRKVPILTAHRKLVRSQRNRLKARSRLAPAPLQGQPSRPPRLWGVVPDRRAAEPPAKAVAAEGLRSSAGIIALSTTASTVSGINRHRFSILPNRLFAPCKFALSPTARLRASKLSARAGT